MPPRISNSESWHRFQRDGVSASNSVVNPLALARARSGSVASHDSAAVAALSKTTSQSRYRYRDVTPAWASAASVSMESV
ncbi:hypothetical protein D3C86_1599680 [compost metagenome]